MGYYSGPALVDLDGDGDLDGVVGGINGTLLYFVNTGNSVVPAFVEATGSVNPFTGIDVGYGSSPELVDLDSDGDLDALVGEGGGRLVFYRSLRNDIFADGFESGGLTAWSNF